MKIRLLIPIGTNISGSIVDAVISPSKYHAVFFGDNEAYTSVFAGQFEIVSDESSNKIRKQESTSPFMSLRDFLGQDIKSLEFK
jgi:hypothetical protein